METIPSSPPVQVFREMEEASRRVQELRARDRALHFEEADGRVMVEVRDGNGTLIRVIPPSEALAVVSGANPE